jgi:Bacterial alpha-L-rhamnosidase concanavalin-like domain
MVTDNRSVDHREKLCHNLLNDLIGVQVFDLGQNIAGWCRFRFVGANGIGIYIRHGEILAARIAATK